MADPKRDFSNMIPARGRSLAFRLASLVVLTLLFIGFIFWFIIRVEVNAGEILVLVNKTGQTLPSSLVGEWGDQVVLYPSLVHAIAAKSGESEDDIRNTYKGIRFEVLQEGRYFPNPYSVSAIKMVATVIGQNEVGVVVRKFGKPLAFPQTVATSSEERGPVEEILRPGRHNVNLLAYDVHRFPALRISEGHAGVVTLLSGREPKTKNTFTVEPGEKGVQHETLSPGLEYYNPYLKHIDVVDVRSQKFDLLNADAIQFPSNDSFNITIEGTIEWAIRPDRVAEVTVAYGDAGDILNKIILPNVRGIARIQGSKLQAREFISGKTRAAFQEKLLTELERECWQQGVDIKSALVRDIQPPHEIAALISYREQADQEMERSTNEMTEARSDAKLVEQRELQEQNKAIGDARRNVVTVTKEAEQHRGVSVTEAKRELEVGKLNLEAASKEASAIVARGRADADVVLFNFQARAEPLGRAVKAFGDGTTYAQQFFLQRVAPSITTILTNTDGPFAQIFKQLQTFERKDAPKGGQ